MMNHLRVQIVTALMLSLLCICGCDAREAEEPADNEPEPASTSESHRGEITMKLTSNAFKSSEKINAKHTVEGEDVSPPLSWTDVPDRTISLALICDEPDAPSPTRPAPEPWVHWVIFNIPASMSELPAGVSRQLEPAEVPSAKQGINSWPNDNVGYRGPAPPPGSGQHRYFFKLYALDDELDLKAGATKERLVEAMSGHVLAEVQLIGVYER
jgi:Raf kinase inhibitor-like YbhB/YbcL family protein